MPDRSDFTLIGCIQPDGRRQVVKENQASDGKRNGEQGRVGLGGLLTFKTLLSFYFKKLQGPQLGAVTFRELKFRSPWALEKEPHLN